MIMQIKRVKREDILVKMKYFIYIGIQKFIGNEGKFILKYRLP